MSERERDIISRNIGSPEFGESMLVGFAISDKICKYIMDNRISSEHLKSYGFAGLIWCEIERIHSLGVAHGRALEKSDGVCKALFGID